MAPSEDDDSVERDRDADVCNHRIAPLIGGQRGDTLFAPSEDDDSGPSSAIRATRASQFTGSRADRRTSGDTFSVSERGRRQRTIERDPRDAEASQFTPSDCSNFGDPDNFRILRCSSGKDHPS